MSENKVALAVGAHPDDVEFFMAGTLVALADAGYELHIFTVGNGNGGTAVHTQEEIVRRRREMCAEVGQMAPSPVEYAEGFRQHLHGGFSAEDGDPLSEILGDRVQKAE